MAARTCVNADRCLMGLRFGHLHPTTPIMSADERRTNMAPWSGMRKTAPSSTCFLRIASPLVWWPELVQLGFDMDRTTASYYLYSACSTNNSGAGQRTLFICARFVRVAYNGLEMQSLN